VSFSAMEWGNALIGLCRSSRWKRLSKGVLERQGESVAERSPVGSRIERGQPCGVAGEGCRADVRFGKTAMANRGVGGWTGWDHVIVFGGGDFTVATAKPQTLPESSVCEGGIGCG
jgi:hypothetical protein